MRAIKTSTWVGALMFLGAAACGSTRPSRALVDARTAYDQARTSDSALYAPASLSDAQRALQRAEQAHKDDPGSERERALAYIAQRRARLAETRGMIAMARQNRVEAEQQYAQLQEQIRTTGEEQLRATRLQEARSSGALAATTAELERERQARTDAEVRAQKAIDELKQTTQVREESRGTILTIPGNVLFTTGKANLLPGAMESLYRVTTALKEQSEDQPITVEGYTDDRGSDAKNQKLSQQRAEAVRRFLVEHGVPSERVTAVGKGESNPMADNDTPEGRAMNRRVEIVIGKSGGQGAPSGMQPGMQPSEGTQQGAQPWTPPKTRGPAGPGGTTEPKGPRPKIEPTQPAR